MSSIFSIHQLEQLLNSVRNDNVYFKNFDLALYIISYLLEDSNNEKIIIAYINKHLKSQDEENVYIYLTKVISTISTETLYENILFWFQQIVDRKKNIINAQRYVAIAKLVQLGAGNQDFNKLIISTYLFKLIDECISIDIGSIHIQNILNCLAMLLETYPNSCGPKKNNIESYLIQYLFCKTTKIGVIKNAAICFQKLQRIGTPGINSINYKNNWKTAFERLCVTLDILYDNFFDDVNEFYKYEKLPLTPFTLPAPPKVISATEVLYVFENRLHHMCIFLKGMLENEFCCVKPIHPEYLLDIITRALSCHICIGKSDTDTSFHFGILLIKNQIYILYLLRSLISSLHLNLLPVSAMISKLLIDCLARTQNCNCFNHISEYKETLYKVLGYWISILKNCFNRNLHDKLLPLIINDISSVVVDVSLNIVNNSNDCTKKSKKAVNAKIISNSINKSVIEDCLRYPLKGKEVLCYQSLCLLITLLTNVDVCITQNTFNSLYTTLTQAVVSVNIGKSKFPYNTTNVKKKLFEALLALMECPHTPAPCISSITNLLKKGEHYVDESISVSCSKSLHVLEKLCQPICPSLYFRDKNNTLTFTEKSFDLHTISSNDISVDINTHILEDEHSEAPNKSLENNTLQRNPEVIENCEHRDNVVIESEAIEINSNEYNQKAECGAINTNDILSTPDPEFTTRTVQEEIFITQEHFEDISDAEDNVEPVQKKPKIDTTAEPDINAMLLSFVDEVSTNVEECIVTI